MNQANQKVVVQTANMTLISIRSAEIAYFSTFFSSFGTQSALIIGFICGSISQVPGIDNPSGCNYFWIVLYWVTSAITVASAVHVLVCTIFISVFGQGLALRGPLGSMVRAVEGMVVEQQQVLYSFIITIVAFAFQAIGMYWIMMDSTSAIASTIITGIGMYGWYHYTLRIYNRFNWNQMKADYNNEENPEDEINELDPNIQINRNREKQAVAKEAGLKTGLVDNKEKKASFKIPGIASKSPKGTSVVSQAQSPLDHDDRSEAPFYEKSGGALTGGDGSDKVYSGFITIKSSRTFTTDPWERNYLVVRNTLLFYYKDKRAYELYPQQPINRRPIDLEGYTLVAGNVEPPYNITLLPIDADDIRKTWKFRCDTLAEFNNWIEVLSAALKLCEGEQSRSDLVVVQGGQAVNR